MKEYSNGETVLTGMEPYRDPFQVLELYEPLDEEYDLAYSKLYSELDDDFSVSLKEKIQVLRMVQDGEVMDGFEYLRDEVLEE